jgi:N-acetylglutamate synthase
MDPSTLHALESAAFAAWPSLEQEVHHGWLLRHAQGYTKRANSANALPGAEPLDKSLLREIEARFEARGLPTIFRLASFAVPASVDQLLAEAGYRFTDLSWVMTQALSSPPVALAEDAQAGWASRAADWLSAFQELSGKLGPDQAAHLRLLQAIEAPCAYALSWKGGRPVCCGLGVLVNGKLGLFDIATAPAQRGQGLAKALCRDLLAWGQRQGAHTAYLQVTATNAVAMGLYQALGFAQTYHYSYRVAP